MALLHNIRIRHLADDEQVKCEYNAGCSADAAFLFERYIDTKWEAARYCEAHARSVALEDGVPWIRILLYLAVEASLQRPHVPESLYHYCSVDSFVGIVRTDQIWASNALSMNDPTELRHGIEALYQFTKGRLPEEIVSRWFDPHYKSGDYALLEYFEDACVACFCARPDLLSQWRAYASGGTGYAIGFDRRRLISVGADRRFDLVSAVYGPEEQRAVLEDFFDHTQNYRAIAASQEEFETERLDAASQLVLSFKNNVFREEEEWRLISRNPRGLMKYRAARWGMVSYVEIGPVELALAEVWLGPTLDQDLAKRSLEYFLRRQYGATVSVRTSEVPLRLT